jgi:lysophospholipase
MTSSAPPAIDDAILPDGTRIRHAAWAPIAGTRPRGTFLVLNGRAEFIEKYQEFASELAGRGFRVVSFDWRGQGLSTRTPPEDETAHTLSFEPLVADALLLRDRLVGAGEGPVVLFGHSMGGGLGLRLLAERPDAADAAIFTAPMIDPIASRGGRLLARIVAPVMVALGAAMRNPPGEGYRLEAVRLAGYNEHLTSDPVRGHVQRALILENPALGVRGVTWGWLSAAFAAGRRLRRAARAIRTPMLVALAGRESLVDNPGAEAIAAAIPAAEIVRYPEARHEILMETDAIRARFWADVDAFLARQGI